MILVFGATVKITHAVVTKGVRHPAAAPVTPLGYEDAVPTVFVIEKAGLWLTPLAAVAMAEGSLLPFEGWGEQSESLPHEPLQKRAGG